MKKNRVFWKKSILCKKLRGIWIFLHNDKNWIEASSRFFSFFIEASSRVFFHLAGKLPSMLKVKTTTIPCDRFNFWTQELDTTAQQQTQEKKKLCFFEKSRFYVKKYGEFDFFYIMIKIKTRQAHVFFLFLSRQAQGRGKLPCFFFSKTITTPTLKQLSRRQKNNKSLTTRNPKYYNNFWR